MLAAFAAGRGSSKLTWRFLRHERNGGKGAAIRTALAQATCELTVIHDADLEYHPRDLLRLVRVFVEEEADAVFGSRFAGADARRALFYRHELGNKFLTFLCNLATNLNLTDMETCYKAVRTDLLKSIPIESNDFRLEPELTIKLAKRQARIHEVPISYSGRSYQEGKKIGWRDGLKALVGDRALPHFRRGLRQGRLRQPHPRAPEPGAEVQRLDRRRHPPVLRHARPRDRRRRRQPHAAARAARAPSSPPTSTRCT